MLYARTKVQDYRSNRNIFFACHYHVVWCQNCKSQQYPGGQTIQEPLVRQDTCCKKTNFLLGFTQCGPSIRYSSADEAAQRAFLPVLAPRISRFETETAEFMDEQVFVSTAGGAPLSIMKQYIEQQKHV